MNQPPNCALAALNGLCKTFDASRLDWRVAADYRFSPALMVYGQVLTGYRSGGVDPRPFYPSQVEDFRPETIMAYEAGFKSDLFDRRVRFNVSAFFNDNKNIILTVLNCPNTAGFPSTPGLQPKNVGSAHVKGIEVETTIRPIEHLTLDGSLSWLKFKYTTVDTANARVTWKSEADTWSVSAEVRNLTNKYYFTSMTANFGPIGTSAGAPGLPRTWAVTVKRNF